MPTQTPPPFDPSTPELPGGTGTDPTTPDSTQAGADTTTDPFSDPATLKFIAALLGGTSGTTSRQSAEQALENKYFDAYTALWGTIPPPGYVKNAMRSGMNLVEFTDNEMQKPAFARTRGYRDQAASMAGALAQALGTRA